MKIGIIGLGVVGNAINEFYKNKEDYEIEIYDPYKGHQDFLSKDCQVIFICVPTPFKEGVGYDLSAIKTVLDKLQGYDKSIICLKCTVLPGTTRSLSEEFNLDLIFNPEFLTARTAVEDFANPPIQIIGVSDYRQEGSAQTLLDILPQAKNETICTLEEAECVKIMRNTFYATKVIFANQFYDYVKSLKNDPDYDIIRDLFESDEMVGKNHWDVWHDNKRGYSGMCLPKEVKAILTVADKQMSVLKEVNQINDGLLTDQNLSVV